MIKWASAYMQWCVCARTAHEGNFKAIGVMDALVSSEGERCVRAYNAGICWRCPIVFFVG